PGPALLRRRRDQPLSRRTRRGFPRRIQAARPGVLQLHRLGLRGETELPDLRRRRRRGPHLRAHPPPRPPQQIGAPRFLIDRVDLLELLAPYEKKGRRVEIGVLHLSALFDIHLSTYRRSVAI